MENYRPGCQISLTPLLVATLVLFILKLCGVVACSWWTVFAPILVVPALLLLWFLLFVICTLIDVLRK